MFLVRFSWQLQALQPNTCGKRHTFTLHNAISQISRISPCCGHDCQSFYLCNVSIHTRACTFVSAIIVALSFVSLAFRTNNPLQRMKQSDIQHIALQLPWSLPHRLHTRARHGQGNRHGVQQTGAEEHD
jgi:hypothetical protein